MQAKIDTSRLEKVLKNIEKVSDKKASMAVLSMVLIEPNLEESTLYFTATDLEIGYKGKVFAEIEGVSAPFCVSAKKLYEIVKNFPEDTLYFIKDENKLVIKDEEEKILYNLSIMDGEDFPSLPEFGEEHSVEIPGKTLAELIDTTAFCTSKEDTRFVLAGIYLEPLKEEGKLRAVSSDGHRLALLDREVSEIENFPEGFIIAKKAAKQIEEIAEDELLIRLGFTNNYVVIWTSTALFFARTIEGPYPDYRMVIPSEYQNILRIDRKLFIDALKRVSLVVNERFKPVTLELLPKEVILTSQETEMGKAQIRIPGEYEGEPMVVNYNADYLLDALQIMKSEEVEMKIGVGKTPAILTGYRDEGFLYLLMPMVL